MLIVVATSIAHAQPYPNKPVRLVVSFPAAEPAPGTPEAFREFLRTEIDKWSKVVTAAKMKTD